MSDTTEYYNANDVVTVTRSELEMLKAVSYCANGMFDSEADSNLGDAREWKRHLRLKTEEYYEEFG